MALIVTNNNDLIGNDYVSQCENINDKVMTGAINKMTINILTILTDAAGSWLTL